MTSEQMRKYSVKNKAKIQSQLDAAPEFDELPFEGKRIGRGFASFKEHINRQEFCRALPFLIKKCEKTQFLSIFNLANSQRSPIIKEFCGYLPQNSTSPTGS